jgi:hypothetical protein
VDGHFRCWARRLPSGFYHRAQTHPSRTCESRRRGRSLYCIWTLYFFSGAGRRTGGWMDVWMRRSLHQPKLWRPY